LRIFVQLRIASRTSSRLGRSSTCTSRALASVPRQGLGLLDISVLLVEGAKMARSWCSRSLVGVAG